MVSRRPLLFTVCGAVFLIGGIITVLSIIAGMHFGQPLSWQHWAYAGLDFLFAYGFFSMQAWILPLIAALLGVQTILTIARAASNGLEYAAVFSYVVILLLGAGILWGVSRYKRKLKDGINSRTLGMVSGTLLLIVFGYTISSYLA